jgi:hypothetical protein
MILFLVPELGWRPGRSGYQITNLSIQTSPMSNNGKATIEEGWTSDLVGTMSGEGVVEIDIEDKERRAMRASSQGWLQMSKT